MNTITRDMIKNVLKEIIDEHRTKKVIKTNPKTKNVVKTKTNPSGLPVLLHTMLHCLADELRTADTDSDIYAPLDYAAHSAAGILNTLEKSFGVKPLEPLHTPRIGLKVLLVSGLRDIQEAIMDFKHTPYAGNLDIAAQLWLISRDFDAAIIAFNQRQEELINKDRTLH